MAAVLKPGSSHIKFGKFPKVKLPTVNHGRARFECSPIETTGSVILTGSQPAAGWQLGFIQVEWVDTNWLYYRGRQNDHGSIFFQRSRPPTRPIKACRDVDLETEIFYDPPATVTAADDFPKTLTIDHFDQPTTTTEAVVTNSLTGEDNFIREAQLEYLFCTVLTAAGSSNRPRPAGGRCSKSFIWSRIARRSRRCRLACRSRLERRCGQCAGLVLPVAGNARVTANAISTARPERSG